MDWLLKDIFINALVYTFFEISTIAIIIESPEKKLKNLAPLSFKNTSNQACFKFQFKVGEVLRGFLTRGFDSKLAVLFSAAILRGF